MQILRTVAATALASLVTACAGSGVATSPRSAAPATHDAQAESRVTESIREVSVVRIDERFLRDGTMQVAITLKNIALYQVAGSYSVSWFDRDGFAVKTVLSNWNPFTLASGEMREVVVTSPGAQAATFSAAFRRKN